LIYKDGGFTELEKAYETGLISKDDVQDLAWYYRQR
jgi:hypothetical protein